MKKIKTLDIIVLILCFCALILIAACEKKTEQSMFGRQMEMQKTWSSRDKTRAVVGATQTAKYERMDDAHKNIHDFAKTPQYERNRATWTAEAYPWNKKNK